MAGWLSSSHDCCLERKVLGLNPTKIIKTLTTVITFFDVQRQKWMQVWTKNRKSKNAGSYPSIAIIITILSMVWIHFQENCNRRDNYILDDPIPIKRLVSFKWLVTLTWNKMKKQFSILFYMFNINNNNNIVI